MGSGAESRNPLASAEDRARNARARFAQRSRAEVLELVDEELVAEHAANPFGRHSDRLGHVLAHLRRGPLAGKVVILCDQPFARYRLARLTGVREERPVPVGSEVYRTVEEAEHAVFRLRLKLLREDAG
ncbi:MAG: hypothetical protein OXG37_03115 [Actinomycetia bacterium]|nr:hypothetical protein [Actinomycetes bacterium]